MGIAREISTKNRSRRQKRKQKDLAKKSRKRQNQKHGEVLHPELVTKHIMKKRQHAPRSNIALSSKKKIKLQKQIKHQLAFKEAAKAREDAEDMPGESPNDMEVDKVVKEKKTKKTKKNTAMDDDE